jgi:hypothetical protein
MKTIGVIFIQLASFWTDWAVLYFIITRKVLDIPYCFYFSVVYILLNYTPVAPL